MAIVDEFGYRLPLSVASATVDAGNGNLILSFRDGTGLSLAGHGRHDADLLNALLGDGATHAQLMALAGDETDQYVPGFLRSLALRQALEWFFGPPEQPLCHLQSYSGTYCPMLIALPAAALRLPLSRFVSLRRHGDAAILDNPEVHARLTVAPAGIRLLDGLFDPVAGQETNNPFRGFLACAGFLESPQPEPAARAAWEFHDLQFHDATRQALGLRPIAKHDRLAGTYPKPSPEKPVMSSNRIVLPAPADRSSPPFAHVLAARRSIRRPASQPLRLDDLSTLLWQCFRAADVPGRPDVRLWRPVPAGGAIHALEYYLGIRRCEGLESGFYHYREQEHALYRLPSRPALEQRLNYTAAAAMGETGTSPDCVVVMASRHPLLARGYEGIAYRLAQLQAGAAMQTLYLVATALGLAPCANGTGDSALFEALTGLSPFEETAIAEFALSGGPEADEENKESR
ncbi:MAG: SagB family peptide dehydrogenase [Oceanibaculum nanhaiense]|jgi:SagB-type dehydrogenase family enzyme|uniref:SagB family peptide dehydrogenase n=1 Tax=Oceanibaculum nanhaiense TaxID=1909734 RepID=UPI0032EB160D